MGENPRIEYRELTPDDGARYVIEAEQAISGLELPEGFAENITLRIKANIATREHTGFYTDPTSEIEVKGLVRAAMGGNNHVSKLRRSFNHFVIGYLQTTEETIQRVSETLLGP
jgi:hypothetical protein